MIPPAFLFELAAAGAAATWAAVWWVRRDARRLPDVALADLDFVAIDTETTGLDPKRDALVALAAVPFVGGTPRLDQAVDRLVNPGRPIPESARIIHGIGDNDVCSAPPPGEVLPELLAACQRRPIVAHTAPFDLTLINRAASRAGLPRLSGPVLDIAALAHALFPSCRDLSLEALGQLTGVEPVDRHTARGDALTAGHIFLRLVPRLEACGVRTLSGALRMQRRASPLRDGFGPAGRAPSGP